MVEFLKNAMASLTYSSLCMPEDITARGLESIPNFFYREDGLRLWDIVHRFVHNVIGHYCTCDSDVQKDTELQNWIEDIFFYGFMAETCTGYTFLIQMTQSALQMATALWSKLVHYLGKRVQFDRLHF
ncbi:polyunsaturated fatty acid lipoxygenase ALOX15B-like [Oncorhynchus keta]|uniref:polyunsaturated fatty acid lipoxygenase ALOX15B-like n=1 Tax=Oncorhynchus keta TaxID=8018 RepID=UPI00227BE766|nr:polyunsaturated fatty acid lipoxygenase ALOX15B-like [Oncorhynchus keta]